MPETDMLAELQAIIRDRQQNPKPGSYTNSLFDAGISRIAGTWRPDCSRRGGCVSGEPARAKTPLRSTARMKFNTWKPPMLQKSRRI